jgi:hypothetical protein
MAPKWCTYVRTALVTYGVCLVKKTVSERVFLGRRPLEWHRIDTLAIVDRQHISIYEMKISCTERHVSERGAGY